jgi:hypothetical protein
MATNYTYISRKPVEGITDTDWVAHEAHQAASTTTGELKYDMTYIGASEWGSQPLLPLPPAVVEPYRKRLFWWAFRYAIVFVVIFVAFLVPIIVFSKDADVDDNTTIEDVEAGQYRNLVYYICLWLEITWIFAVFFDVVGLALPYLFRFIARYVHTHATFSQAQRSYNRFLADTLILPISGTGASLKSCVAPSASSARQL